MSVKTPPAVLAVAALDPVCAAGLGADILTLRAHRCHPLAVVAAATEQDCERLRDVWPLPAAALSLQLKAAMAAPLAAIKIGAIVSAANARALSRFLDDKKKSAVGYPPPVVWDPVFAASGGGALADDAAIAAMKKYLLPRAYLITPNRAEALRLAGIAADAGDDDAVIQAARRLRKSGARNVLVTGADGGGKARIRHLLFGEKREREWSCRRLDGVYHGSGCAFAAAIAANLAHRRPLIKAIGRAQIYTDKALRHSYAYAALGAQKIPRR